MFDAEIYDFRVEIPEDFFPSMPDFERKIAYSKFCCDEYREVDKEIQQRRKEMNLV